MSEGVCEISQQSPAQGRATARAESHEARGYLRSRSGYVERENAAMDAAGLGSCLRGRGFPTVPSETASEEALR
jgi:hypothetical protein